MIITIALYFKGDSLEPDDITKRLQITPSQIRLKGEKRVTPTNREVVAQTGIWKITTRSLKSTLLNEHVSELHSLVKGKIGAIRDIAKTVETVVDIYIGLDEDKGDTSTATFQLSAENLTNLHNMGLPIQFTMSFAASTD